MSQRKKIRGWLYLYLSISLSQEALSLSLFSFCSFCCPKMEAEFRIVCRRMDLCLVFVVPDYFTLILVYLE